MEPDDSSLIDLSIRGDVAKKLLHYLKQNLPSSCLSDLLCSHTFSKHYLRRGGGSLEDEELLGEDTFATFLLFRPQQRVTGLCSAAESSLTPPTPGGGTQSFASSSSAKGSVSKKAKKDVPQELGSSETESELPEEDDSKYPDDLEDKMKGGDISVMKTKVLHQSVRLHLSVLLQCSTIPECRGRRAYWRSWGRWWTS